MSVEESPFIAFIFMPLRAFPASRRFLNCTKAKPRIFPSVRKCTKTLKVAGGSQQQTTEQEDLNSQAVHSLPISQEVPVPKQQFILSITPALAKQSVNTRGTKSELPKNKGLTLAFGLHYLSSTLQISLSRATENITKDLFLVDYGKIYITLSSLNPHQMKVQSTWLPWDIHFQNSSIGSKYCFQVIF